MSEYEDIGAEISQARCEGAEPVKLVNFQVGYLRGEYYCERSDLLIHYFWEEPIQVGHAPTRAPGNGLPVQDNYSSWPPKFREALWKVMLDFFDLEGERERLQIEWIPELRSWCVTVKGTASILKPPVSVIEKISDKILNICFNSQ